VRRLDHQPMLEKVERHGERSAFVREAPGPQTARCEVEGTPPAVVHRSRSCQRDLANDLHPHVQRGVGVLPRCVRKFRPGLHMWLSALGSRLWALGPKAKSPKPKA